MSFKYTVQTAVTSLSLLLGACSQHSLASLEAGTAAVACSGGVVRSSTQLARYQGCAVVEGDLRIEASDVDDLEVLASLREVSGQLSVTGTGLCSLRGLDGLRQVGALEIVKNPRLISLQALNGLEHAKSVHLELNPRLAGQPGLLPAVEIERAVVVRQNAGLGTDEVARLSARLRPPAPALLAFHE